MTDERLELYAEEYFDLPALSRRSNIFTFETYVISREDSWSFETIKNWLIGRRRYETI